jgi:FkbM family methyltransferase
MSVTEQHVATVINGRWPLFLPPHRAARPQWLTGWERERLDAMRACIRPGDVVYDIGAEEGDLSALYAMWTGPEGGIVLIEPNPRVWSNIAWIWEHNRLPDPLACFVGFAGPADDLDRPGWEHPSGVHGWPLCARGEVISDHGFLNLCERPDVPVLTLDTLSECWGDVGSPDVVSIDVEGAELQVLQGTTGLLEHHRPLIFVSIHPAFMRELYGQGPADLHGFVSSFGYVSTPLAVDHEEHWMLWHPLGRVPVIP